MNPRQARPPAGARIRLSAITLTTLVAGGAQAFEIETGNSDLSLRWDNTVRLNYGQRVQARDPKIGNAAVADEGDYSFDKGDAVTKRLDLLTEMDLIYRKRSGVRVSATAWYDGAYGKASRSNPNPPLANLPSYTGNQYNSTVKRLYAGPSGEFLDAFVFGGTDIGDVPVDVKLGRHTIYWGESLLLGGNLHSVAYGQNPLDLQKGFATPGVEAKELFRPLNQISVKAQVSDTVSLAAQYMLEWAPDRFTEGGTYLGPVDFVFNGPDRQFLSAGLGFAYRGPASEPKQRGEYGVALRWSPAWLDGTLGFYYRNYADKIPHTLLTKAAPANGSVYNLVYGGNIDLFGISLAKNVGGISIGAELSVRHNTPLTGKTFGSVPGLPAPGDTNGPRGNTLHGLVNAVGVVNKTALFDTASWAAELTVAEWTKVLSGADNFNGLGFAPCKGKDKWDGCVTKRYAGIGLGFTPVWFQVLPGVDLSAPLNYSIGLSGNAPVGFGGNQGLGNFAVGLAADVQQKHRFDLKYVGYFGHYRDNGTAVTSTNGFTTYLKDRGFVNLTFKTTF